MEKGRNRLLLFNVAGQRYALELLHIAEVSPPTATFPVPWVPEYFKGAMNFHGNIVAVVDLVQVLGTGSMSPDGNVLVLNREIANLGLGVDAVDNIITTDDVLEEEEGSQPLIEKVLFLADGEVGKLALFPLLERITAELRR